MALCLIVLAAGGMLISVGIHGWLHRRAVARYEAGERALALLQLPPQFQPVDEMDCRAKPDVRCLHTQLNPYDAAARVRNSVPSASRFADSNDCRDWELPLAAPCRFEFRLGSHPAVVVVYPHIVIPPAGETAPAGVRLISPDSRSQSYYDGAAVSIALVGGPPS